MRVEAPEMREFAHVRRFVVAGLIDSFGLAVGWTIFNLHAIDRGGLGAVGFFNAAMLVGVALSAPLATRLAIRLDGRALLRTTAVTESLLRVASFCLLLSGAPTMLVALSIFSMNVVGWTGFAAMRAEIAGAHPTATTMTWYMVAIGAIEAMGIALASLLPVGPDGVVSGAPLLVISVTYGLCLVPTYVVALGAQVPRSPVVRRRGPRELSVRLLTGSGVIMLLASGPTLLFVALAAEMYGRAWVAAAAVAFSLGSLLAPRSLGLLMRRGLPIAVLGPLWGLGMIAGWSLSTVHVSGLLVAQFLSGLSMSAFEGMMDADAASSLEGARPTGRLASAAAVRAFGSAAAVSLLPGLLNKVDLASLSTVSSMLLLAVLVGGYVIKVRRSAIRHPEALKYRQANEAWITHRQQVQFVQDRR